MVHGLGRRLQRARYEDVTKAGTEKIHAEQNAEPDHRDRRPAGRDEKHHHDVGNARESNARSCPGMLRAISPRVVASGLASSRNPVGSVRT